MTAKTSPLSGGDIPGDPHGYFTDREGPDTVPVAMSATLVETLKDMEPNGPEQMHVLEMLGGALHACASLFEAPASMENKMIAVHNEIDSVIREDQRNPARGAGGIKCRAGCGGCCSIPVSVSFSEAQMLVKAAVKQNIPLDEGKLYRQSQAVGDPAKWREMSDEDRRCVFLSEENNCRVYEVRPAACRKYFSVTDPEFCNDKKYPGHPVGVWFSLRAEVIDSAAMTVFGAGHMAEQLIKAKRAP